MIFLPASLQPRLSALSAVITAGDIVGSKTLLAPPQSSLPEKSHVTPVNHVSPTTSIAPRHRGSTIVRRSKYQDKGGTLLQYYSSDKGPEHGVNNKVLCEVLEDKTCCHSQSSIVVTVHRHGLVTRIWGVNGV